MTTITYDIFQLSKDLKKANISDDAIDAIVKFEKSKEENNDYKLATKVDLSHEIAIVKRDIIIWLGCINTALAGIIISAIALLK
jgi:hypothetical protein